MATLEQHASNIVSQNGEDGILAEIFRRIQPRSRLCVEFGAWDGKHLSNTWALWHESGWSAVLIEGDRERFRQLQESIGSFPEVQAVHAYVVASGPSSLDNLLSAEAIAPDGIDLLSIDIDGDDYNVWDSLNTYRPRVVVIEYNPTIPPELDLVQREGEYFGASAAALTRLAKEKGYGLAACTATNCIYVREDDFSALGFPELDLTRIFDRSQLCHVINAYDGRTYLTNKPVYSRPLPLASYAYWSERLKQNLFVGAAETTPPAESLQPVSLVLESLLPRRSLQDRVLAMLARTVTGLWDQAVAFVTALPPYRFVERLVQYLQRRAKERSLIQAWRRSGSPVPPPHLYKQKLLTRYASRYRLATLVETGTYLGDMIFALRHRFKAIISIELSTDLCQRAQQRLREFPHISIIQGDSSQVLPRILEGLSVPTLFWLDGHYSAGNTALGDRETPVSAEVDAILRHPVQGHVVLIDDARNFDGTHDYPTLAALSDYVHRAFPKADFTVKDDIIRIVL
ncbi:MULTISPECIES: hypothetical protein [unclassified Synechococcus]|uniref:hypothetical protein n=1 Tax=unclassified Synechococcus TaxID=2626047 RepID=UPI001C248540|nr:MULTISPECIES: hypothetical protein [unclassified Synechococcus]